MGIIVAPSVCLSTTSCRKRSDPAGEISEATHLCIPPPVGRMHFAVNPRLPGFGLVASHRCKNQVWCEFRVGPECPDALHDVADVNRKLELPNRDLNFFKARATRQFLVNDSVQFPDTVELQFESRLLKHI